VVDVVSPRIGIAASGVKGRYHPQEETLFNFHLNRKINLVRHAETAGTKGL